MVTATVPELVTLRLWLLVDPTATLPNDTAAGLTLSAPEVPEVLASEFVASVELPLALVMPEQPVRIDPAAKRRATQQMTYELRQP